MANTYTLIASTTVGAGGASSIDFTSIPATYTDLLIKFSARTDGADVVTQAYFNGDMTASNYSARQIYGDGATVTSASNAAPNAVYSTRSTDTANTFANSEFYIPNYTSSNKKSGSADNVEENNGATTYASLIATLWNGTSAITSIKLQPRTAANYVQYTTAYLYGIKNS